MKAGLLLIGFALQAALWLAAPVEAQLPSREREPTRVLVGSGGPPGPIADLASSSISAKLSFSRVVATLQASRGASDVRNTNALIDPDAIATRLAVAVAFARRFVASTFVCHEAVATFATWLPPPVLQIRSNLR